MSQCSVTLGQYPSEGSYIDFELLNTNVYRYEIEKEQQQQKWNKQQWRKKLRKLIVRQNAQISCVCVCVRVIRWSAGRIDTHAGDEARDYYSLDLYNNRTTAHSANFKLI